MPVNYNSSFDGQKINEDNCFSITGYDAKTLLTFTGVNGYTPSFTYEISGTYPMLRVKVFHAEYELQCTIYFDETRVKNEYFHVKLPAQGIEQKIFTAQATALAANGFDNIRMHALGGEGLPDYTGHITWAKLGFTMDFGSEILQFRSVMKDHKRKEQTLNDLVKTEDGCNFWMRNGFSWNGLFKLSENSENQKILKHYLA